MARTWTVPTFGHDFGRRAYLQKGLSTRLKQKLFNKWLYLSDCANIFKGFYGFTSPWYYFLWGLTFLICNFSYLKFSLSYLVNPRKTLLWFFKSRIFFFYIGMYYIFEDSLYFKLYDFKHLPLCSILILSNLPSKSFHLWNENNRISTIIFVSIK